MTIFLIPNLNKARAAQVTDHAVRFLLDAGAQVLLPEKAAELLERPHLAARDGYSRGDVVLTVGGDGTILQAARAGLNWHKPILGINLGRTGFLATCEVDQLEEKLDLLLKRQYRLDDRMLLDACIQGLDGWKRTAMNDISMYSSDRQKAAPFDIYCDGLKVNHFRGDGVVVATPTGSTAYSLSAGGPILDARISGLIVTPVCAHSIHCPPIVFSADRRLVLQAQPDKNEEVYVSCDGAEEQQLPAGATVVITKSDLSVQLVEFQPGDQFRAIDEKLRGR